MQLSKEFVEIKMNLGVSMKIDAEDWEKFGEFKWFPIDAHKRGKYYVMRKRSGKTEILHRLIMNVIDKSKVVDHINHDTLDNRKINLRVCSRSENQRNLTSHKDSISKYLGVTWHKSRNKWQAQIKENGKNMYIGVFVSEVEAAKAYDERAKKHHKEFANLNFK